MSSRAGPHQEDEDHGKQQWNSADHRASSNILEIDGDFDLFGDGTLRLLKTPGHTPGHQVLIVNLPSRGRVCLAADTGHVRDGFEDMIPMPGDWSANAISMTRMQMKQLERSGIPLFLCQ